jgi:indole-3-glycerol phosphate synthase
VGRFSQAIAEGDGISVIPMLQGDVEELAVLAEEAGAEAVAVAAADVGRVRARTSLPIIARGGDLRTVASAGADAWILPFQPDREDALAEDYALARDLDLDCAVEVRDEEALEDVLEQADPDILLLSERGIDDDEEDLERTLDLLPDVPAGKLVISQSRVREREQVVALERAGVDAILVEADFLRVAPDFASALAELTGR